MEKLHSLCIPCWFRLRQGPVISLTVIGLFILLRTANSQETLRKFPPLINAAKDSKLDTIPSQSTCGIPSRTAYCRSATYSSSVFQCLQDFCIQACPRRTALPSHMDLLQDAGVIGFGPCISVDRVNKRPGAPENEFAAIFRAGPECYLRIPTDLNNVNLGVNGAFTLTFWMWQDTDNRG